MIKNTLKQTKFEDKTVKSTQPSLALIGLHDFLIFSNRMARAWSVEAGNTCSVSVFFVRVGSQNISTSGEERFKYPLPRENKISKIPYPRDNKDNQIPTLCPAPPPPRWLYIDRCIGTFYTLVHGQIGDFRYKFSRQFLFFTRHGDHGLERWIY